jgi:hypothetical protein
VKARLKALGARLGPFLLVALVAAGVGYWSGSRGRPARVEQTLGLKEVIQTEQTRYTYTVVRQTTVKTAKKARQKHQVVEIFNPNGSLASRTTTSTGSQSSATEIGTTDRQSGSSDTSKTLQNRDITSKTVTEFQRSDWRLTALVGAQLQDPFRNAGNPFAPNLFLGLNAERRIFGPFWGGVFVAGTLPLLPGRDWRTNGALYGGVSLSVEF